MILGGEGVSVGKEFFELIKVIGYEFHDIEYLQNALTHSSYANERRSRGISYPSNERLEFLGDAVLQLLISEYLYENFEGYAEGALTKIRQQLVCEKSLAKIARQINLGEYLNVGRGEELTDCRKRPKVLADALEAIVAAIYLDSGKFTAAKGKAAVLSLFEAELSAIPNMQKGDYKTMLQQLVEKDGTAILEYRIASEDGPEHCKSFTVEAVINNNKVGEGTANNKKEAEMLAARQALLLFGVTV